MLKAFRYSGSKDKIISLLRPIPSYVTQIIEPFAGSLSFSLNSGRPFLAWDTSKELISLWKWLKVSTPQDLLALKQYEGMQKVDVRSLPICTEAKTYLRINIASVMTGQLSSWSIYPQHRLPIDKTLEALPMIKKGSYYCGNAAVLTFADKTETGSLLFLDPPYINTRGNYSDKNSGDLQAIETVKSLVKAFRDHPIILTYGDGAEEVFPDYSWETILVRKVPNLRCGGTVERREKAAYLGTW